MMVRKQMKGSLRGKYNSCANFTARNAKLA